jgi:hypothetical protein
MVYALPFTRMGKRGPELSVEQEYLFSAMLTRKRRAALAEPGTAMGRITDARIAMPFSRMAARLDRHGRG